MPEISDQGAAAARSRERADQIRRRGSRVVLQRHKREMQGCGLRPVECHWRNVAAAQPDAAVRDDADCRFGRNGAYDERDRLGVGVRFASLFRRPGAGKHRVYYREHSDTGDVSYERCRRFLLEFYQGLLQGFAQSRRRFLASSYCKSCGTSFVFLAMF